MASVDIRLNNAEIKRLLTGPNGPVVRDLMRRGQRVQNAARRLCPVDEGRLRASITTEMRGSGEQTFVRIGSNLDYALWVHEGTGVYAGRGFITPKRGQFLRWEARNNSGRGRRRTGRYVFARRVRGVRGRPFLRDALDAARG